MLPTWKIAVLIMTAMGTAACSSPDNQLEAMVPASARSVSYIHQSDSGDGVTFHVIAESGSYQYVQAIRDKLLAQGFSLCEKSAIRKWEAKPIQAGKPANGGYWLSELYKNDGLRGIFMIHAEGTPVGGGTRWRQGFVLAAANLSQGSPGMASLDNFCD